MNTTPEGAEGEEDKQLWEFDHEYHCSDVDLIEHDSWKEFIDSNGDCDFNKNLLFRWDWIFDAGGDGEDILCLYWVLQRKGRLLSEEIKVNRSDEPEIIKWLNKRFDHLLKLWAPISSCTIPVIEHHPGEVERDEIN